MVDYVLKLHLEAPLQSYGLKSKWDSRDTGFYPSKSAIIGLLGSAFGYERKSPFLDFLSSNLKVHVRIDKEGKLITDLQTVNQPVRQANGSIKKNKDSSYYHPLLKKDYLQDAIFIVYITGERDLIYKCYEAVKNPVWPIYLGRKSCIPSTLIYRKEPEEVLDIESYIKNDEIENVDYIIRSYIKTHKGAVSMYFYYVLEEDDGNITVFDNLSSKGYKYYQGRAIKKGTFSKDFIKDGDSYVFK